MAGRSLDTLSRSMPSTKATLTVVAPICDCPQQVLRKTHASLRKDFIGQAAFQNSSQKWKVRTHF